MTVDAEYISNNNSFVTRVCVVVVVYIFVVKDTRKINCVAPPLPKDIETDTQVPFSVSLNGQVILFNNNCTQVCVCMCD